MVVGTTWVMWTEINQPNVKTLPTSKHYISLKKVVPVLNSEQKNLKSRKNTYRRLFGRTLNVNVFFFL